MGVCGFDSAFSIFGWIMVLGRAAMNSPSSDLEGGLWDTYPRTLYSSLSGLDRIGSSRIGVDRRARIRLF